jgi:uncharacterized protein YciI
VTTGTLVAEDGETPVGSLFVVEDRNAVKPFVAAIPYPANDVWERMEIHSYHKKRG